MPVYLGCDEATLQRRGRVGSFVCEDERLLKKMHLFIMEKHFIYFNQKDKCNRRGNFMHCAGIYLDGEGATTRIKGRVGSIIFKDERFLKKLHL